MNTKLREIVLDSGSTDPMDWSQDDRREAVLELYQRDEKARVPTWIGDALSECISCDTKERQALLAALEHDSPAMRHAAIGVIVERALLNFPLDTLQQIAEEREGAWRAEQYAEAAERDRDSRAEARLLNDGRVA